jgi:hypothetical protein
METLARLQHSPLACAISQTRIDDPVTIAFHLHVYWFGHYADRYYLPVQQHPRP